jgi:triosephosphate isomerase (TIM)
MNPPLIAGNWKMNGSTSSIKQLLQGLLQGRDRFHSVEMVVLPPYPYLELVSQYLQGSPIGWGAQNMAAEPAGAFTGEVCAAMLQDFHCQYVVVGHSERRTLYGETDAQVAAKFVAAFQAGLRPILCVGETAAQRREGETLAVIERQLAVALKLADNLNGLSQAVIAYEPVWAIGTGQHASPEQAQEVHQAIRQQLRAQAARAGEEIRIIYGGSVKPDNAAALFRQPAVDGALVGGASLQADQLIEIAQQCKH